jgi:hypothetical protein
LCSLAAAALAIAVAGVAMAWQSTALGGADQYSYVTEAGLLGEGTLTVHQDVPYSWPYAEGTWTPIGYSVVPGSRGTIAPMTPPGLPLLMAALQTLFGFCAAFWVAPICAGLTIWCTYLLGGHVFGRVGIGLAAAVLVAVSPVFLAHIVSPLSDVPATAVATLALVLITIEQPVAAGLAAATAIAIRPNLAPLALAILVWTGLRDALSPQARTFFARSTVRAALAIAPVIVALASLNVHVYGSALRSGYGVAQDLYSSRHLWTNVVHFSTWISQSDTPIVALALVFFVAPGLLPSAHIPFPRVLLGGVAAVVILSYVFYQPFEQWVFLRFLLPMWPVVMVLTAAAIVAAAERWLPLRIRQAAPVLLLGVLAWHHLTFAVREHVFVRWQDENRYVDVGRYIAATTDPAAVFVSWQQSGSIRLYADRLTLNFARLDRDWLDRTVDRLRDMGRRPYFVIEGFEEQAFRERFSATNRLGSLDWTPIAVYRTPYVAIYDPDARQSGRSPVVIPGTAERSRHCLQPAAWPPPSQSR